MEKPIAVRLDEQAVRAINAWRKTHDDPPTKSEAARQLIEAQLTTLGLWKPEDAEPAKPAKKSKS